MNPRLRLIIQSLPFVLWMSLIFFMSTDVGRTSNTITWLLSLLHIAWPHRQFDSNEVSLASHLLRKAAHFTEFLILTWLGYRAARYGFGAIASRARTFGFYAAIIYAVTDEIHQLFIPSRTGQFKDFAVDILGCLVGLYILKRTTTQAEPIVSRETSRR
jgi:VanZ family protein